MTYAISPYCAPKQPILRCAPRDHLRSRTRSPPSPLSHVHLIPCDPPTGAVESAPATSLGQTAQGERLDGFWHLPDERYHARLTRADGSTAWFRFADEVVTARSAGGARVLTMRRGSVFTWRRRQTIMVGTRRGSQLMLVGAARRRMTRTGAGGRN